MKTVFFMGETDISQIKAAIEGDYKIFAVPNPERLIKLAERIRPDLILVHGDDAIDATKTLTKTLKNIPVIIAASAMDGDTASLAFEAGASDIICKPFVEPIIKKRIESFIEADNKVRESQSSLRHIQNSLISVIAELVEDRDKITGGHIERTQQYLKILMDELIRSGIYADEISKWDLGLLLPSAQLHDVGKITISDLILNKPAKLTDEEFSIIKSHASEGERIINEIMNKTADDGFLMHAKKFAGYHHEKWNGTGYPHRLEGTDIPLEGRIMAIADVYDALVSARPYKKPFSHEKAIEIIVKDAGTHFDPLLVDVFVKIADDFWVQSMVGNADNPEPEPATTPLISVTVNIGSKDNTPPPPKTEPIEAATAKTTTVFSIMGIAGDFNGKMFAADQKLLFGRGNICSIRFTGQIRGISTIHCSIEKQDDGIYLHDKNSTFGTFLNNVKVNPTRPMKLVSGDEFWLGSKESAFRIV